MGKLERHEMRSPTNELHSMGKCREYCFWKEHLKCASEETPASLGGSVMLREGLLGTASGSLVMGFQGLWESAGQVIVLRDQKPGTLDNYYSA